MVPMLGRTFQRPDDLPSAIDVGEGFVFEPIFRSNANGDSTIQPGPIELPADDFAGGLAGQAMPLWNRPHSQPSDASVGSDRAYPRAALKLSAIARTGSSRVQPSSPSRRHEEPPEQSVSLVDGQTDVGIGRPFPNSSPEQSGGLRNGTSADSHRSSRVTLPQNTDLRTQGPHKSKYPPMTELHKSPRLSKQSPKVSDRVTKQSNASNTSVKRTRVSKPLSTNQSPSVSLRIRKGALRHRQQRDPARDRRAARGEFWAWRNTATHFRQDLHACLEGAEVECDDLKQRMRAKEGHIVHQETQLVAANRRLHSLENENDRMAEQIENAMKSQTTQNIVKERLQKKYSSLKDHLNLAIAEQQELYKANKARMEQVHEQVRQEENNRMLLEKQMREETEAHRDRITRLVNESKGHLQSREDEFQAMVSKFDKEKASQQEQLNTQQSLTDSLCKQLDVVHLTQASVIKVQSQIAELKEGVNSGAVRLEELDSLQANREQSILNQIQSKLDSFANLPTTVGEQLGQLQITQAEQLTRLLSDHSTLQEIRSITAETLDELRHHYQEHREELLEDSRGKQHDVARLTELVSQGDAQRSCLQEQLNTALADVDRLNRESHDQQDHLKDVLEAKSARHDAEASLNTLARKLEVEQSKSCSATTEASNLRQRLRETECTFEVERNCMQNSRTQMEQQFQQALQIQAASSTRTISDLRSQLNVQATEERVALQSNLDQVFIDLNNAKHELQTSRAAVSSAENNMKKDSEAMEALRKKFDIAAAQNTQLTEALEVQRNAQEENTARATATIDSQLAKLSMTEERVRKLTDDAEGYDEEVQSLRQTVGCQAARLLGAVEAKMLADRIRSRSNGVDPRFARLCEIEATTTALCCAIAAGRLKEETADAGHCANHTHSTPDNSTMADGTTLLKVTKAPLVHQRLYNLHNLSEERRVLVQSPDSDVPTPEPPSVAVERSRRRTSLTPRSILKAKVAASHRVSRLSTSPNTLLRSLQVDGNSQIGTFGRRSFTRIVTGSVPQTTLASAAVSGQNQGHFVGQMSSQASVSDPDS